MPNTRRQQVLDEASRLIHGPREKEYGPPAENFRRAGQILHELLPDGPCAGGELAVLALIATKLARMQHSPNVLDHYADLTGYIAILWELRMGEIEK